LPEFLPYQMWE
jgi:hypothetical protein